jgi:hypothetical protein
VIEVIVVGGEHERKSPLCPLVVYSPHDEMWVPTIEGMIAETFSRRQMWDINKGEDQLFRANLLIFLVSPGLLDALPIELRERLHERYASGQVCYIAIYLKPAAWYQQPLDTLPILPADGLGGAQALSKWKPGNLRFALARMRLGIREIVGTFEQSLLMYVRAEFESIQQAIAGQAYETLAEQGIHTRLFELCEALVELGAASNLIEVYLDLAAAMGDVDPSFAALCQKRAEALRQQAEK